MGVEHSNPVLRNKIPESSQKCTTLSQYLDIQLVVSQQMNITDLGFRAGQKYWPEWLRHACGRRACSSTNRTTAIDSSSRNSVPPCSLPIKGHRSRPDTARHYEHPRILKKKPGHHTGVEESHQQTQDSINISKIAPAWMLDFDADLKKYM